MRALGLFFIIWFFIFGAAMAGFYLFEEVTNIDILSLLEIGSEDSFIELIILIMVSAFIQSIFLTLIAVGILHRKETKDVVVVSPPATQSSVQDELNRLKMRELERQVEEMRRQQEHMRYMPPPIEHRD